MRGGKGKRKSVGEGGGARRIGEGGSLWRIGRGEGERLGRGGDEGERGGIILRLIILSWPNCNLR